MNIPAALPLHRRYLNVVDQIERTVDVVRWRDGDADIWPIARMDLYLDMFRSNGGDTACPSPGFLRRAIGGTATPLTNAWKSRRDLVHWVPWPCPADAILLGDGVSLDRIDGEWQDRYGEPLIAALESRGRSTFVMQNTQLNRLPWRRPTFAANVISAWGAMAGTLAGTVGASAPVELPGHDDAVRILALGRIISPSLDPVRLARRARIASAAASAFERVLRIVKPKMAFVVTYYAGLGHAFALACRRQGILCVDLQHCPQDGAHKAYSWSALPDDGYSTLPGMYWTWKEADAAHIQRWAGTLAKPWHQSLHGGHTQLAAFRNDEDATTLAWDRKFEAIGKRTAYDREILVALQPVGGHRAVWDALAGEIESAPAHWRWWIRRHPASTSGQDGEYARLLSLHRPNVVVDEATALPLPALLRHMSIVISLASGVAGEASEFGVPALFLSAEALGPFAGLIDRRLASIVDVADVTTEIARIASLPIRPESRPAPSLHETLLHVERAAENYALLCREAALSSKRG